METFSFLKWIVTQTDRGLFIAALALGGWLFWRVLKRSETQTDQLVTELNSSREQHHERMTKLNEQVFENCQKVTDVVATNTTTLDRNNRVLERLENKL